MSIMEALASDEMKRAVAEAREYVRRQGGTGEVVVHFDLKDNRYLQFRVGTSCRPFYGPNSHVLAPPSTNRS